MKVYRTRLNTLIYQTTNSGLWSQTTMSEVEPFYVSLLTSGSIMEELI